MILPPDKDNGFYRYIYPHHNGWRILKDNIHYGYYEDVADALLDRDNLEKCDWDLGEWVYIEPDYNPYKNMRLPPYYSNLKRARQYVYHNNGCFRIQKRINGVLKQFGNYKTLKEALDKRDELIENNWRMET